MKKTVPLVALCSLLIVGCYWMGAGTGKGAARPVLFSPSGADPVAGMHNDEGVDHALHGDIGEAARHFREALEIDGNFAEAHFNLGHMLDELGEHEDAASHFSRAWKMAETSPNKEKIRNDKTLQDHR